MLDENLPAFFLKPSSSGAKHQREIYSSHHGNDPVPAYALRNFDPASPLQAHKNCYGAALFDSYIPDVVYGEVIARPGWTQPTLSAEELRRNGGVPPPPQPILPSEFVVQLYNPDQQVRIEVKEGKWGASDSYEFSMPERTFRTPSASNLDRGQDDPATLASTPKINFVWRKESKLSKDLTCYMVGRSTDALLGKKELRKARKDPDIAIALWRSMRELTVYEPNLQRLELEDPKGLEVVLLLGALVIRDVYFGSKDAIGETFNISDVPGGRKLSGGGRKLSSPHQTHSIVGPPNPLGNHPPPTAAGLGAASRNDARRNSLPKLQTIPPQPPRPTHGGAPPPADPRAQWQIDAETARLKAQAEAEAKEERRRRREREKADEAEAKRLQRMVEEEERVARRKQAEIDKETERLRKQYGVQQMPAQANSSRPQGRPGQGRLHAGPYMQPIPQRTQMSLAPPSSSMGGSSSGLYMQQPSASSSAVMMSGANGNASSLTLGGAGAGAGAKKKKSFFGLRSASDDTAAAAAAEERKKLNKKSSAMW
ncbi:Hypothetical predicted protein [Lecanosticta acicola]|uniref:Uncharacterized protein n=1 Tax=Lecanosticta acicola TaxID=111012 RepID=A0AAI8YXJ3_9PEZI|nr:Hypothetical predicted protein [Lecanosticta acicola]